MTRSTACAPVRARLSLHLDGRLAARAELLVRRHLGACEACRAELGRTRAVGAAIAELQFDPPVGLAARARSAERRRARASDLRRGVARAAAALVILSAAGFAGLAGLRIVRDAGPVAPRLVGPSVAGPALVAPSVPASPAPARNPDGLRRVPDGPALADWTRLREAGDAAAWLAKEREGEAPAPGGPPGATAGFRAPR